MIKYLQAKFAVLLLLILPSSVLFAQDGDVLFEDSELHEIRFSQVDTMLFINTKDYQEVDVLIDGNALADVGFKRKGNISAYPETNKYAIKIKTNKYVDGQEYDGIKEFTLHMNYQDPSMLREKLTYELCNEMGLHALRTAFAKVYIDDKYWGLYTLVEAKDEMFKQQFDNRDMDAIESLDFGNLCYLGADPAEYDVDQNGGMPYYKLENGDGATAWPRFVEMLDVANNTPTENYIATVLPKFNLEDFFTLQVVNVYLLNFDSYIAFMGNQIFIYDDKESRWEICPWDFNASFGLWETGLHQYDNYPIIPETIDEGCIASKINEVPELKNYYLERMCEMMNEGMDTMKMYQRIDFLRNQIADAVYEDHRKVITNEQFDKACSFGHEYVFDNNVPGLKSFVRGRYLYVKNALKEMGFDCAQDVKEVNPVNKHAVVYPNPVLDVINLKLDDISTQGEYQIQIYNAYGSMLMQVDNKANMDVAHLPKGVYTLRYKSANLTFGKLFVKQ